MIIPCNKLMIWSALVVVPFSTLAAWSGPLAFLAWLVLALFGAAVLLDLLRGRTSLDGIAIQLPEVARLAKDREGAIEITVINKPQKSRRLKIGLELPREFHSPAAEQEVLLPGESPQARFSQPCVPRKRGRYLLRECRLETKSPLGLWAIRKGVPVQCDARVYPNLLTERQGTAAVFLSRGLFGIHAQRQVGKGRDFERLREYLPGDSSEDVHWKATAKRARPMAKIFQVERTQEIYVIIDSSRLSGRTVEGAAGEAAVLERFITAGLVLGLAAEKQGDLFGLLTFNDRVENFVRAKNGRSHYNACRDAIYRLQPKLVTPDFQELCSFVRLRLRRRALLVFLTSLDDPALAESFTRAVELICRQHLIVVNMVSTAHVAPLFAEGTVASVDDLYLHLGGHLLWSSLRELENILRQRGVSFAQIKNEKLAAALVTQYLNVKRRQSL